MGRAVVLVLIVFIATWHNALHAPSHASMNKAKGQVLSALSDSVTIDLGVLDRMQNEQLGLEPIAPSSLEIQRKTLKRAPRPKIIIASHIVPIPARKPFSAATNTLEEDDISEYEYMPPTAFIPPPEYIPNLLNPIAPKPQRKPRNLIAQRMQAIQPATGNSSAGHFVGNLKASDFSAAPSNRNDPNIFVKVHGIHDITKAPARKRPIVDASRSVPVEPVDREPMQQQVIATKQPAIAPEWGTINHQDESYHLSRTSAQDIFQEVEQQRRVNQAIMERKRKSKTPVSSTSAQSDELISFMFQPGAHEVTLHAANVLSSKVLPQISTSPQTRIQIKAFSSEIENSTESARRISLARALSVRQYLLDAGMNPGQIDIRALGDEAGNNLRDRVDILFFKPQG